MSVFDLLIAPFADYGFMRRALMAAVCLGFSAGPIGVFLLLRRMSLMGDAMAHAVVRLDIAPDWTPRGRVDISYDWTDAPHVDFMGQRIDIAGVPPCTRRRSRPAAGPRGTKWHGRRMPASQSFGSGRSGGVAGGRVTSPRGACPHFPRQARASAVDCRGLGV